jgi:hypothetical protein
VTSQSSVIVVLGFWLVKTMSDQSIHELGVTTTHSVRGKARSNLSVFLSVLPSGRQRARTVCCRMGSMKGAGRADTPSPPVSVTISLPISAVKPGLYGMSHGALTEVYLPPYPLFRSHLPPYLGQIRPNSPFILQGLSDIVSAYVFAFIVNGTVAWVRGHLDIIEPA